MPRRSLSPELITLIHHVELSNAGWRDRLADQLILAALDKKHGSATRAELESRLLALGAALDNATLQQSVSRLVAHGSLLEDAGNQLRLSQEAQADLQRHLTDSSELGARAQDHFKALAKGICPDLDADTLWVDFQGRCLEPLIAELGARTYELVSGSARDLTVLKSMSAYLERFTEAQRSGLSKTIDLFLDPTNADVRNFVLQRLNAHFLGLAANLSEHALTALTNRLKRTIQLKIFLDTNFLFSLLDLHENPANEAAKDLVQLLREVQGRIDFQLFVYPLTIDEARHTLAAYEITLSDMRLTPKVSRAALGIEGAMSGIVARYLRTVTESGGRLSAHEYFAPYLSDLLAILRARGIELYNANVDQLTTSQVVIDDILAQQEFGQRNHPDRAKSYETLRHDVALWHLVAQRRASGLESPLEAIYWIVTVDYSLLGFDAFKVRQASTAVPVCIHPAILIQMLQLWLPRSAKLDMALIHSVRALLPQVLDPRAEQVTIKILATLSRFENVDDLSEDTLTSILLNQALRNRIGATSDASQQVALIRDALLSRSAETDDALRHKEAKVAELERAFDKERIALASERSTRVQLEENLTKVRAERQTDVDRLSGELAQERAARNQLVSKVDQLSAHLSAKEEEERQERARAEAGAQRRQFYTWAVLLALLAIACVLYVPGWLSVRTGLPMLRMVLLVASAYLGIAGLALRLLGRKLSAISESPVFQYYDRSFKWLMGTLWTLFLGLLVIFIWERLFGAA
jgi:hypothetical protein